MAPVQGGSEDSYSARMPIEESFYAWFATRGAPASRSCLGAPCTNQNVLQLFSVVSRECSKSRN